MTVHYGYNYKKDLIKKMNLHYQKELDKLAITRLHQLQLDEAQNTIVNFFAEVKEAFVDLSIVSNGNLEYEENANGHFLKMKINQSSIQFTRKETLIEIEISSWNNDEHFVESRVHAVVIPGEKKCHLRKIGNVHGGVSFEESVINSYVRHAFAHLLLSEE